MPVARAKEVPCQPIFGPLHRSAMQCKSAWSMPENGFRPQHRIVLGIAYIANYNPKRIDET